MAYEDPQFELAVKDRLPYWRVQSAQFFERMVKNKGPVNQRFCLYSISSIPSPKMARRSANCPVPNQFDDKFTHGQLVLTCCQPMERCWISSKCQGLGLAAQWTRAERALIGRARWSAIMFGGYGSQA